MARPAYVQLILITLLLIISSAVKVQGKQLYYPGDTVAGTEPSLFAPGLVCTGMNERDLALAPDSTWILWTVTDPRPTLVGIQRIDGSWDTPQVMPFSGVYSDIEPAFSPDGTKLFYASNRPYGDASEDDSDQNYDIWAVTLINGEWGEPENLGQVVNTPGNEYYPSVAKDGTLYFTVEREGGFGSEDIWMCDFENGSYANPRPLPEPVNSAAYEFNAYIDPDERFLLYTTLQDGPGIGGGDIYITYKLEEDEWSEPLSLGEQVNSSQIDFCPFVSPDGKFLFFSSKRVIEIDRNSKRLEYEDLLNVNSLPGNGRMDIYWMDASILDSLRP